MTSLVLRAQEKWSLQRCIEHAISNNLQIKMEQLNAESKEIDLHTANNSWLPSVSASAGQSFNFGRGADRDGITVDHTTYSTSMGLSTSMPLFTGFRITNEIKYNRYSVMAAQEALKKAQEDIAVAVARAFLDVLLRKEILRINTEALNLTIENVTKTEAMVKNGSVPLAQLYEIKSQHASDEASVTSADNDVVLGLLTLGQLLEITYTSDFDIEVPQLNEELLALTEVPSVQTIYTTALEVKPQIRVAELQLDASKMQLQVAQAGHYPQLSLSAGINDGYTYNSGVDNNPTFGKQLDLNLSEYVGLNLSIPIFSRFSVQNSVKQAKLGIVQQQLTLDNNKKTLYKEIQQAYHNAIAAQKNYRAAQKNVEAAQESFRYAQIRYQTGNSSVYEFAEVKTKLTRVLSEAAQAKYNYVFAEKILNFYAGLPITL